MQLTYILKAGARGCDAFHAFCQIRIGELVLIDCGVIPNKSIFISPFVSIGIGWESVEAGTEIGFRSSLV